MRMVVNETVVKGIAIIDQPSLRNHIEYEDRIIHYEEIDVQGVKPQMHGPPVCSIAVGKSCGVAPAASLVYYAMPMWEWDSCRPYCRRKPTARPAGATF